MQADESPEDRLEAALDRIAHVVQAQGKTVPVPAGPDPVTTEVAERLDRIIATVRAALGDAQQH